MTHCEVLRCTNRVAQLIPLRPPDDVLQMQGAVCTEHHAQMEAGTACRWEDDPSGGLAAGCILMGVDLDVSQLTITKFLGTNDHGLTMAPDGGPGTTLLFEQLLGDGSRRGVRLLVGESVLDALWHTFDVWLRPRPEEPCSDEDAA